MDCTSALARIVAEFISTEDLIWRRWRIRQKEVWVVEESCLWIDMSVSKITPKFLTELAGSKDLPAIKIEDENNLIY